MTEKNTDDQVSVGAIDSIMFGMYRKKNGDFKVPVVVKLVGELTAYEGMFEAKAEVLNDDMDITDMFAVIANKLKEIISGAAPLNVIVN
jgi:hypothetical protein